MDPTRLQEQPESTIGHKPFEYRHEEPTPAVGQPTEGEGQPREAAESQAEPAAPPAEEETDQEDEAFNPGA